MIQVFLLNRKTFSSETRSTAGAETRLKKKIGSNIKCVSFKFEAVTKPQSFCDNTPEIGILVNKR